MEQEQTNSNQPTDHDNNGNEHQDEPLDLSAALAKLEDLGRQLEAAKNDATGFKDKYLRAVAEAENARRRAEKEKSDILQYGLDRFMNDLLPVLDSVDNAVHDTETNTAASLDSLKSGFDLVKKQLTDTLQKHGLSLVDAVNADFDPNLHQAIQRIESEDADTERVKQVFVKGYTLNGRLLRAAMVSVEVPKN